MASGGDNTFIEESTVNLSNKPSEDPSNESGSHISSLPRETSNVSCEILHSSPTDVEPSGDTSQQESQDRYANCYAFLKRDYDARSHRPLRTRPALVRLDDNSNVGYLMRFERVEHQTTFWGSVRDWYFKHAGNFRTSKYIYILPLMYSALFISSIVMGLTFASDCTGFKHVPYVGVVTGMYGVLFMPVWAIYCFRLQRRKRCKGKLLFAFIMFLAVLVFIMVIDAFVVFHMQPSYKPSDENYCNRTFYHYSLYRQLVTAAAFFFAAIVYLPPYRHDLCCDECMGPPSGAPALPMPSYQSI